MVFLLPSSSARTLASLALFVRSKRSAYILSDRENSVYSFSALSRGHSDSRGFSFVSPLSTKFSAVISSPPSREIRLDMGSRYKVDWVVPEMDKEEIELVGRRELQRYSCKQVKREGGKGVSIVWFRNDLRILDNETLLLAWKSSEAVLPVFCVDPRLFGTTHYFGFPKTGAHRAQFFIDSLDDLRKNLLRRQLNLLICYGKPEDILPSISETFEAHTIYAQKETCSEETHIENLVDKGLKSILLPIGKGSKSQSPKLQLVWGSTLYHLDDLPFSYGSLPDVYTQFRKSVESKCKIRSSFKVPEILGPLPAKSVDAIGGWGCIPSLEKLGIQKQENNKGMHFVGGESGALARVHEYFWKKDLLKVYKETRNGMIGPDYSTKFSPWLASGSLSPRYVYEEVKRYEKDRLANDSTYWVLFELIWRDYFRFVSMKYGNAIFHLGGPRKTKNLKWSQDQELFKCWMDGRTGYPLIDANMKELASSGFMSNRGRQIVCSFLVRDMGIDWRMGAEWFESCLLDYDPCSNYGNWTYGAGVGNDPREDRYFSIPKQAQTYDPEGEYVAHWLPEIRFLSKNNRHFPGRSYINPVVPLKFASSHLKKDNDANPAKRKPRSGADTYRQGT